MNKLEEYRVWRPMSFAILVIVVMTAHVTFTVYQLLLQHYGEYSWFAGYLFPMVMGFVLAWRLDGKFWLGVAWVGFAFYGLTLPLCHWEMSNLTARIYMVSMCLAILFGSQGTVLWIKRQWGLRHPIRLQ